MTAVITLPGFADPVMQAQSCFRAVLAALSVPGSLHPAGEGVTPPSPLHPATAAVLLSLVDGEVPLAVDPDAQSARDWLAFHCGASIVPSSQARFVLALSCPDLSSLPAGGDETPEDSATIILQLPVLGQGRRYRLSGPGLKEPAIFQADGLPDDFVARWAANRAQFPRGVDVILTAGTTLAALPRGVQLEEC